MINIIDKCVLCFKIIKNKFQMFLHYESILCYGFVDLIILGYYMDHNIILYSINIDNYKLLICDILRRHKIFLFSIFYYIYSLFHFVYACMPYHNTQLMFGDEKTSHEGWFSSSTVQIPGMEFRLSWMALMSLSHCLYRLDKRNILIAFYFIYHLLKEYF